MADRIKKSNLLRCMLFTAFIIFIYLGFKNIPLYGVDLSYYQKESFDLNSLLHITVGGNHEKIYIMSLGITPYIFSSLCIQILYAFKSEKSRLRISPKKTNEWMIFLSLMISIFLSILTLSQLTLIDDRFITKVLVVLELVAGSSFTLWLVMKNKEEGIGGPSPIIVSNIIGGLFLQLKAGSKQELLIVFAVSILVSILLVIMEIREKRIYLQRVSIHNSLADKNYLAIKYNPIGVMPVMFSSAFFIVVQFLFVFLAKVFPANEIFSMINDNLSLTNLFGILVYMILLFLLTVIFSFVFINPSSVSEQLLQNGDSIINMPAGKQTRNYIRLQVLKYSSMSGIVLSISIGISFLLQYNGMLDSNMAMLSSSFMILSGICCNLFQECYAIKCFDSYRSFL